MKRIKRYKALAPNETIKNISNLLLNKLGINLIVTEYSEKNNLFFSSHVDIKTDELTLNIGTNGKGVTKEFALASAYGEFMERIQNGMLFHHRYYATEKFIKGWGSRYSEYINMLKEKNILLKYAFAPDEKFITECSEIRHLTNKYIKSYNNEEIINEISKNGITVVPFYNITEQKVEMLPITIIHNNIGSNGMCAGNYSKEAIIQGLSEIIERYVMRLIYQKNLTLPSIPKTEFIGNDIYDKIITLEKSNNINIDIKDCSCGYGIPAIGVLITENDTNKYQFRIGVDPSPVTALERSLTELFQGRSNMVYFNMDIEYQTKLLDDITLKEKEFRYSFMAGIGQYPISMFYNLPSYNYLGFDPKLSSNDNYDLDYMIKVIKNMGYNIYIRDVSFLGFPSYRIYIPGMSELNNIFSNNHFNETYKKRGSLYSFMIAHNLFEASKEDILLLLNYIDRIPEQLDTSGITSLNTKDAWNNINIYFLAALLCIRFDKSERAINYIRKAININPHNKAIKLYKCCIDLLCANNDKKIQSVIKSIYGEEIYKYAFNFLYSSDWLSHFNLTNCFNCNNCKIKNYCLYVPYFKLLKQIENEYENNLPDQEKLQKVFN